MVDIQAQHLTKSENNHKNYVRNSQFKKQEEQK